jgi:hypothetical protein
MGTSDITYAGSGPASGRTSPTPISTPPPWPRCPRRQERQRCWKLVSGRFNRAEVVRDDEASAPLWPGSPASRKRIRRSVNAAFLRTRSDFLLQLTTSVIPSSAYIRMTILTTLRPFFFRVHYRAPRGTEPRVALRVRVHDPWVVIGIWELAMPLSPPWCLQPSLV